MTSPSPKSEVCTAGPLTGEQRYRQARKLAQLRANRRFRKFMAGELPYLQCSDPRPEIIRELDRAYAAGLRDGFAKATLSTGGQP